ncbi:hypothetical protein DPV78_002456 [Talaromyces pinophilus]|jgi:hypothetical protein|nr:hypothetical protein DPV78_002456 [Talaromyces pinophilus]
MLPNKQQREQKIGGGEWTLEGFLGFRESARHGKEGGSGRRLGGSGTGKWVPGLKHGARFQV